MTKKTIDSVNQTTELKPMTEQEQLELELLQLRKKLEAATQELAEQRREVQFKEQCDSAAKDIHRLHTSLVEAGFSEEQAFTLLQQTLEKSLH